MKKVYNYFISVKNDNDELDKAVNLLNKSGYEMVAVIPSVSTNNIVEYYKIFAKRFK